MISLAALTLLLSSASPGLAAPAPPTSEPTTLKTTVSVLVGQPDTTPEAQKGMAIPTGTVIVPAAGNAPSAERYMRARKELRAAYRLGGVEQTAYDDFTLVRDAEQTVAAATKSIAVKATLLSFDDETAVYRVRLLEATKEAAAPVVSVKRGQWAIVGGRDGSEAPYFFVLIRPTTVEEIAEEKRWEGMTRPKLLDKVMPNYPEAARKASTEGAVALDCLVDTDGSVKDLKVKEGGDASLNEAAMTAVRQWRYEPAKDTHGKPVTVHITVTISFWLS
jgi:TonB family protein